MKRTILLRGGLGNQMFQYALAISLRHRGYETVIDRSMYQIVSMHNGYELENVFGISEPAANFNFCHNACLRLLLKIKPPFLISLDSLEFNSAILSNPHLFIDGYWQDERYFTQVENKIRQAFQFQNIDKINYDFATKMHSCNSVALHLRRGDYAAFGMSIIGEEYYKKAVREIKARVENPIFFVFSDDANEAEKIANNLGLRYEIMTHNLGNDSFKDMFLMSQCKHNIIANSSFSWWAAWLNCNRDKIIVAPRLWDEKHHEFHPQSLSWTLV